MMGTDIDTVGDDFKVNQEIALKYSTVFTCCKIIAETYTSAPISEYKKKKTGWDRDKTNDTGILEMLQYTPNPEMDANTFHELGMYQLNLHGNFISKKLHNRFGEIVQLSPFDYNQVTIKRDKESKRIVYDVKDPYDHRTVQYHREDLYHVVGNTVNGIIGMSPISYGAAAIKLGLTYQNFNQKFYQNGAFPSGMFEHPGSLKDTAYERLKEDLKENWQGMKNHGKPMLLEDGLEYKTHLINPVDAQLLESRKYQVEDVARMYRVPLHLLNSLDKASLRNIEHQSLEFIMFTMLPWYKRNEMAMNTQLLTRNQRRAGYYFEFNIGGLLRGDLKAQAEWFAKGRQWGWLSVNDIRRMLNLNSIPNGDIYLQPMNMIEAGEENPKYGNNRVNGNVKKEIDNLINEALKRGVANVG
jgi:HK97 family phage portal protein